MSTSEQKRDEAVAAVEAAGFPVKRFPNPWHLKVGRFDWWPTSEKYHDQRAGEGGRGNAALLAQLRRDREEEESAECRLCGRIYAEHTDTFTPGSSAPCAMMKENFKPL